MANGAATSKTDAGVWKELAKAVESLRRWHGVACRGVMVNEGDVVAQQCTAKRSRVLMQLLVIVKRGGDRGKKKHSQEKAS